MEIKNEADKKYIIFYHGDACLDGAMAYAVKEENLRKNKVNGNDILGVPLSHNDPEKAMKTINTIVEENPGSEVIFVDYFPNHKESKLFALGLLNDKSINLNFRDHHPTAFKTLTDVVCNVKKNPLYDSVLSPMLLFSQTVSSAIIIWEETHPQEPIPAIIQLVSDADLNQLKGEESKQIAAYLDAQPKYTPEQARSTYEKLKKMSLEEIKDKGKEFYVQLLINTENAIDTAKLYPIFSGNQELTVLTTVIEVDRIEDLGRVGVEKIKQAFCGKTSTDFVLIARPIPHTDKMNVSVVPCNGSAVDAEQIALYLGKKYNGEGGGRKDQAAFQIPVAEYKKMANPEKAIAIKDISVEEIIQRVLKEQLNQFDIKNLSHYIQPNTVLCSARTR